MATVKAGLKEEQVENKYGARTGCDTSKAAEPDSLITKVKNLVSRRRFIAAAGSVAASLPFFRAGEESLEAADKTDSGPIVISKQGSFFVGGTEITTPGTFNPSHPNGPGATYHIDHMYMQFQTPAKARQYPIVMTHGTNQTGKTFESTPDGRDGFRTIFLRKGFTVYLNDHPRRARAGFPSFNGTLGDLAGKQIVPDNTTRLSAQQLFVMMRLGPEYPNFYPDTQFPKEALEQFFRYSIPNVGDYNMPEQFPEVATSAFVALLDKIGPAIMMPHSMSGPYAMMAATRSSNVKAIYGYEPAQYVYPKGEPRPEFYSSDGSVYRTDAYEVPLEDFLKLTKIPICILYGDYVPKSPDPVMARDARRGQQTAAKLFVEALKRHGGDATFVSLPEIGIHGNGHYPFVDRNNSQIADLAAKWLHDKGLDKRVLV
jgi:hypothetical protein